MEIGFLLILILLNGVFAMSEIAVVTARKARLQQLADAGDKGAREALALAEHPTRFLSTVQIGITSIGVLTGIVGEGALADPLALWFMENAPWMSEPVARPLALTVVVVLITFLSIVLGELVPKRLGQISPEPLARLMSRPMRGLSIIATPFVHLLTASTDGLLRILGARQTDEPPVSEAEIQVLMRQGAEAGIFERSEHEMVRNVFRLDDRKLSSLMVPRGDIVWLDVEDESAVNRAKIEQSDVSRFPVCKGDLGEVLGFARAKDLLASALAGRDLDLTARLAPALYVPETLTGTELIENLRSARSTVALVVDEYGEVQGLVTLKDVLEAIIGELPADAAEDNAAFQREDGSWLLDGAIAVPEMQDKLAIEHFPEGESDTYHTLGGMMMLLLGRIPRTGEHAEWAGWRFEVVDMDGNRVDKVMASRLPEAADA
ncbi:hemolysin family protein [Derxia gummosa]|uniref:Hemolysin family protein n=1 Tax=Derxia gummosa DSM 723 TaxID=1121388 RepID=A0A8B6X171_9BURK|nr:hemolysin family protein [Derxia gummosa]